MTGSFDHVPDAELGNEEILAKLISLAIQHGESRIPMDRDDPLPVTRREIQARMDAHCGSCEDSTGYCAPARKAHPKRGDFL